MTNLFNKLHLIIKFKVYVYLLVIRKRLYSFFGNKDLMINIGGGLFFRPHWKVMDHVSPYYPFAEKYIDYDIDLMGTPRFQLADESVLIFYSSHTLEHIPQEFCQNILNEIYRCLKPGGVVRLTMPDYDLLRQAADTKDEEFFSSFRNSGLTNEEIVVNQIAHSFVVDGSVEEIQANYRKMDAVEFADYYTSLSSREAQREKAGYHINWFNFDKLSAMAAESGFKEIYKSTPQGSRFKELVGKGGIFATGNFLDGERRLGIDTSHPDRSLFVEAIKS